MAGQERTAEQGAQLGTQTVGLMPTPPAVVTDKDHSYLKDVLSWELVAAKKCHEFSGRCQDGEVKGLLDRIGRMHQAHYQRLLGELDPQKTLH